MIPMVDLKQQYADLKPEIDAAISAVLSSSQFILGPNVAAFEKETAAFLDCEFAISCGSGTDALHLALAGLGIGPGDEVITSTFTFIATAEAIEYVGAKPVFVDIDAETFNLDPAAVEAALTPATRAIIPVHLFGRPADMAQMQAIAIANNLLLIEDCAQSFGAKVDGKRTGTIGHAGCFSFFPSKNLGCYGDGGLISTNDPALAERIQVLRNHGSEKRYEHSMIGYNSRLDEIQAAILRCKLTKIDDYNAARYLAAKHYNYSLAGIDDLLTPELPPPGEHVFHQYTLLSKQRDNLIAALKEADIASAIYYPIPLHQQKVFVSKYGQQNLPNAELVAQTCLSLPMYPELGKPKIDRICDIISKQL